MKLLEIPVALPGSCYICGSASREYYIDLEVHVEFHGRMYLCNVCVGTINQLTGSATPEEVAQLVEANGTQAQKIYELGVQNAGLERAVLELTLVRSIGGGLPQGSTVSETSDESDSAEGQADSGPTESAEDDDMAGLLATDPFAELRSK